MELDDRVRLLAALGDRHRLLMIDALAIGDRTFRELADLASLPGNLAAHHLAVLEVAGLIERHASEGDRRRRYISLLPERLDGLLPGPTLTPGFVVFLCTRNSARSQFAAALWRERAGREADSAGTEPAERVHPGAVAAARSFGLDLGGTAPKSLAELERQPDLVISVCDRARETDLAMGCRSLHWSIPDPVPDGRPEAFRASFAAIAARVDRMASASRIATMTGGPP